jgi:hypothetical protein
MFLFERYLPTSPSLSSLTDRALLFFFIFFRESYPPYGFYILNRVGMDDYIQRLYPEDDITTHGGYLMLRSYPQFTNARLEGIHSSAGDEENKFSAVYAYATDGVTSKGKGESQTIGLWTFTTDGREPLMDVMLRCVFSLLHGRARGPRC